MVRVRESADESERGAQSDAVCAGVSAGFLPCSPFAGAEGSGAWNRRAVRRLLVIAPHGSRGAGAGWGRQGREGLSRSQHHTCDSSHASSIFLLFFSVDRVLHNHK